MYIKVWLGQSTAVLMLDLRPLCRECVCEGVCGCYCVCGENQDQMSQPKDHFIDHLGQPWFFLSAPHKRLISSIDLAGDDAFGDTLIALRETIDFPRCFLSPSVLTLMWQTAS